MANRLFVFGIGGTGSRVIKSLAMMMASGCKLPGGFDTVVPILIDPDTANGDLNRTKEILRLYQSIRAKINQPNDFFGQEVKTIHELTVTDSPINPEYFQFEIKGAHDSNFKEYIGYNSLNKKDKLFLDLLYSHKNLNSALDVGFKGNPHMGSVVLNQFTHSDDFQKFARIFAPGDAVFIVNSIFGGTGAAGFPLLLNTLRDGNFDAGGALLRKAPIGGMTFLPYFQVEQDEESEIDSESFKEKAKMALNYYNRNIVSGSGRKLNALYFLGLEGATNVYENKEGKREQKNKAHFLELAGALSVFDFCKDTNHFNDAEEGTGSPTQIKEFGIEQDNETITFDDLYVSDAELLRSSLTRFRFFSLYLNKGLGRSLDVAAWTKNGKFTRKKSLLTKEFFNSPGYKNNIKKFLSHFDEWIEEMDANKPAFSPFKKYESLGKSLNILSTNGTLSKDGFKEVDIKNSLNIGKVEATNSYTQLVKLFEKSTRQVLDKNNLI